MESLRPASAGSAHRAPDPTVALTEALVALPSVTPNDAGCIELLAGRLVALGFRCERIDRGGVGNLWARRGDAAPLVCLAGHADVVPPGPLEQWTTAPFSPTRRNGKLFGRGAADMKGSLAAFVTALESFVAANPGHPGSLAVLLTADEEGDAIDGTVAVIDTLAERGEGIDFCVVGEPTSVDRLGDTIKNGRRGSLSGRLTVRGLQGHIAYPHLAKNPIHLAAPAIAELAAAQWDCGNAHFPPTTWQISNIRGGTGATNVIPGEVEILFNFRFSTANTPESLQSRLEEILHRHRLDFHIDWLLGARPFLTEPGMLTAAVIDAIAAVTGITPELSTSGGTSDGRFITRICPEVVEFGPVNASIHKIDEHVAIDALPQLATIYRKILEKILLK